MPPRLRAEAPTLPTACLLSHPIFPLCTPPPPTLCADRRINTDGWVFSSASCSGVGFQSSALPGHTSNIHSAADSLQPLASMQDRTFRQLKLKNGGKESPTTPRQNKKKTGLRQRLSAVPASNTTIKPTEIRRNSQKQPNLTAGGETDKFQSSHAGKTPD